MHNPTTGPDSGPRHRYSVAQRPQVDAETAARMDKFAADHLMAALESGGAQLTHADSSAVVVEVGADSNSPELLAMAARGRLRVNFRDQHGNTPAAMRPETWNWLAKVPVKPP